MWQGVPRLSGALPQTTLHGARYPGRSACGVCSMRAPCFSWPAGSKLAWRRQTVKAGRPARVQTECTRVGSLRCEAWNNAQAAHAVFKLCSSCGMSGSHLVLLQTHDIMLLLRWRKHCVSLYLCKRCRSRMTGHQAHVCPAAHQKPAAHAGETTDRLPHAMHQHPHF